MRIKNIIETTNEFMQRIFNDFKFVSGFSDITTPIETILKKKEVVFVKILHNLQSQLFRSRYSTRYVSGYIQTIPQREKEKLFGADASHAWFSIYIPDFGWADFDQPTIKFK